MPPSQVKLSQSEDSCSRLCCSQDSYRFAYVELRPVSLGLLLYWWVTVELGQRHDVSALLRHGEVLLADRQALLELRQSPDRLSIVVHQVLEDPWVSQM